MVSDLPPPEKRFKDRLAYEVWRLLWFDWDPIGLNGSARWVELDPKTGEPIPGAEPVAINGPDDEYDFYVWPIVRLLHQAASRDAVADYLDWARNKNMGMSGSARHLHLALADSLITLRKA